MNEKLQKIYDLYRQQGIIKDATLEQFAAATPEQQQALFDLGAERGLFTEAGSDQFKEIFPNQPPTMLENIVTKAKNLFTDEKSDNAVSNTMMGKVGAYEPEVKKKADSTELPSGKSSSALPSKPKTDFEIAAAKMRGEFIPPTGTLEEQAKAVGEASMGQSYMGGTAPLQPAKKSEKKTYVENLGTNLMAGLNDVNKMIVSIPETVYDVFSIPQNVLAYATGWDISTNSDKFRQTLGVENPIIDYYKEEGKRLDQEIQKYNEENYKSSSIYDNIKDGNYGDAFELLGSGIVRSAPVSVSMMVGGATLSPTQLVTAGTVGFYGENYDQLKEENPDASEIELNIKALTMSAAETVFSAVGEGQIGAVYRDIIKKEGAEAGTQIFKNGLVDMYKEAIKKYGVPVGLLGEGIEEAATQITQNMVSGKPAFQGAADAFILGGGSGVAFTAPITLKNAKDRLTNEVAKIDDKKQINAILSNNEAKLHTLFDVSKDDAINESQFKIASLGKSRDLLVKDLSENVRKGVITQEQANQSLYVFDKTQQVAGQLRNVDIDEPSKVKVANLLKERDALSEKIQGKDEALSVLEKERIGQINEEIKKTIIDSKAKAETAKPSYSINGKEMSEADFSKAISEMPIDEVKNADIKATNASESVTNLLKDVATRSGVESAPMMETTAPAPAVPTTAAPEAQPAIPEEIASLKDDEPVVIKVATLEEIPEQFRDRAEKSKTTGTVTTREKILGLPIGKKTTTPIDFGYTYTLTGKEAKDYAIQKSKSEESVLRSEQPEVELPTMGEGNAQETTAQEGVTPAKPEEVKPITADVSDAEYNDFIDKGTVSEERINSIADKVKNREPLSDRETQIFSDKTSEINKIIAKPEEVKPTEALKDVESTTKALEERKQLQIDGEEITTILADIKAESIEDAITKYEVKLESEELSAAEEKEINDKLDLLEQAKAVQNIESSNLFINSVANQMPERGVIGGVVIKGEDGKILGETALKKADNNTVEISDFNSSEAGQRKGTGLRALKVLTDIADKTGTTLKLFPSPIKLLEVKGLTKEKIINFYEKGGFKLNKITGMMEYIPESKSPSNEIISEAYHKAKADGSNPELVKAVEDLIGKPTEAKPEEVKPTEESIPLEVKVDLSNIIKTRLREEGVSQEERNKLTGTRENPIITSATKADYESLLKSYKESKQKQLADFEEGGKEEGKFIPEKGIFISSDVSFYDNKIKAVEDLIGKPTEAKPIEQEVSELEQMFPTEGKKGESKGVSVSDKSQVSNLEKRTTDENRKRIIKTATKALNTLKSIFPNMEIVLHDNQDSYNAQMAIINNPYNSAGTFTYIKDKDGNVVTGRIDINLDKANMRTVAHEVAHAIMLKSFGDNVALFKKFRNTISKVLSDSTVKEFDNFASNYSESESHEEFLVELAAVLSENEEKIPINTTQKIAELINKVVSKITGGKLQPFSGTVETKDLIDFLNNISSAISKGESIELDGVSEKINSLANDTGVKVNTSSLTSKASLIQDLGLKRFDDMNSRITRGVTLKSLGNVTAHLTFSDRLVTGKVGDKDYLGGILFAAATNRVWASFTKTRVSQIITGMVKNKDGYRYLMPSLLTDASHMSNKDMSTTAIKLVEDAITKNEISPSEANERIKKALNRKGLENFLKIYTDTIGDKELNSKLVVSAIDNAIIKSNSTFDHRNDFLESLLGKADIDVSKRFGTLPSYTVLANGLAEPITNGHDFGDILLVIRTKGDLIAVQPKEGDPDYHPSYPWVIRAVDSKGNIVDVETLIFDKSYNAIDVFPEVTNKQGQKFTYQQYVDKYGDGAKARYLGYMGARSTMSTSVSEQIKTNAKPKAKVNAEIATEVKEMDNTFTISKAQVDAYHGSPYDFDKFTTEKIGTGEGAQAFGWGLYFTDLKDIAKTYAKQLGSLHSKVYANGEEVNYGHPLYNYENFIIDAKGDVAAVLKELKEIKQEEDALNIKENTRSKARKKAIAFLEKNPEIKYDIPSKIYDVTLHEGKTPDQYTYLEWDKKPNKKQVENLFSKLTQNQLDKGFYYGLKPDATNADLYKGLSRALGGDKAASLFLLENGIDGIKYPAESIARGATSETARGFNYVVFDENAVTIVSKAQKVDNEVKKIVREARAQGYSEQGIKAFLMKKGFTEEEADGFMKDKEAAKKIELKEDLMPGYDKMMRDVDEVILGGVNRGRMQQNILKDVLDSVRKSDAYKNATDQQREEIEREVKKAFGEKMKSAPSAQKVLGLKENIKQITMALSKYHQQRYEDMEKAEANKEKAIKKASKELVASLKGLVRKGQISTKQMAAVLRKFVKTNVLSKSSVKEFTDYMSKVFADADYANKLSEARTLKKIISKASKNKSLNYDANLVKLAVEFKKIDPAMVEDIDQYNKMASQLKEAIKGSKAIGAKVKFANTVKISEFNDYVEATLESQKEKIIEELRQQVQDLLGIDASTLSYQELIDKLNETGEVDLSKENEEAVRVAVGDMFKVYSDAINSMLSSDVDIKESKIELVKRFMKMDISKMKIKDAIYAVDALNNFMVNGSTAKMEKVLNEYEGQQVGDVLLKKKIKADVPKIYRTKWGARNLIRYFLTVPMMIENFFKGAKAQIFERETGIRDLISHKSQAQRIVNVILKNYTDTFYKLKPNKQAFNTAFNNIERNMLAYVTRAKVGQEAQSFKDRKSLIDQSIKNLKEGDEKQQKKAELYQQVFDKILKDSKNAQEVMDKVDPINAKAFNYWVDVWSNFYEELADVSENIHNKILGKDMFYTPDKVSRLEPEEQKELGEDMTASAFHTNSGVVYKKKTGRLEESTLKDKLPDGSYIDLSFDNNNANLLLDALVDIKTAGDVAKLNAFLKSDSFKKVFPNAEIRKVFVSRMNTMVRNFRNKNHFQDNEARVFSKFINRIGGLSSAAALTSGFQLLKQTISVGGNTLLNAGIPHLAYRLNKAKFDFINNSGEAIANRGAESQADINAIDSLIKQAAESKGEKALQFIEEINKRYLSVFLKHPDIWIAKASWMAYYEKGLRRQGIKTKNINYSDHKLNKEAAQYAQRMVDRQQNISDADLKGEFFSSKNALAMLFSKIFFPLASFRINAWARMNLDLRTIFNKNVSLQDREDAIRSLAGGVVESVIFNAIGISATGWMYGYAMDKIRGADDDDEDKEKQRERDEKYADSILKGRFSQFSNDLTSPLPITDWLAETVVFETLDLIQELKGIKEDDRLNIFEPPDIDEPQKMSKYFGAFGISIERLNESRKIIQAATTGKIKEKKFGQETVRYVDPKDKEMLSTIAKLSVLNASLLLPADAYNYQRNIFREISKQASTKTEAELIQEKAYKREKRADNVEKLQIIDQAIGKATDQNVVNELLKMKEETRDKLHPKKKVSDDVKEALKAKKKREKAEYESLLGGYESKDDLERYNPNLYEQNFGKNSYYYQTHKAEMEARKLIKDSRKNYKDRMYNYQAPPKKNKRKKNKDGSLKKIRFSSFIKS